MSGPALTFQVFYNMSVLRPHPLSDHTDQFRRAAETAPKSALLAIQLMTVIAKAKPVNMVLNSVIGPRCINDA